MKFLCDNCKAKYQIDDEKVAGRTVRMKCRKCGHLIEVKASVTETSVAGKLPTDPAEHGGGEHAEQHEDRSSAIPSPPKPATPAPAAAKPAAARPAPAAAAAKAPAAGGLPRPGAATPAPKPPVGAKPVAPKPAAPAAPAKAAESGLAGAFSKAVAAPAASDEASISAAIEVLSTSSSTEEWYVGINGVPVGPVRLAELRRKAAGGALSEDSLVWREGFEEWLPLRTFPELVAMLQEAAAQGRASLTPAPAPGASRPTPPAAAPRGVPARPAAAPRGVTPAPRSNVVSITSRLAIAEKLEEAPAPPAVEPPPPALADPFASLSSPAGAAASPAAKAASPDVSALSHSESHSESIIAGLPARARRSRQAHPAAWAVVGLAGVLVGLGAAILLTRKPAPVQIVTVQVPAPTVPTAAPTSTATAAAGEGPGSTTIGAIEIAGESAKGATGGSAPGGAKPGDTKPAASAGPAPANLAGLAGLTGGPTAGPAGGTAAAAGGGALAQADIERVVQSHRAFVKRQCWETALAAKSASAPSSARVTATLNIAGDGHVSGVNVSGGDGYPGLASCVQGQTKNWRFPPSDGASVTVPFVFAAQ